MNHEKKPNRIKKLFGNIESLKKSLKNVSRISGIEQVDPSDRAIKLCDEVIEWIPEFRMYKDFGVIKDNGKEDPFAHFGILGRFLTDKIQLATDDDPVVKRAFQFINAAYNDLDDKFVRTMLGTEVLENLTISEKTKLVGRSFLKGEALELFVQMTRKR